MVGKRVVIPPMWSYWDITNCPPWNKPKFGWSPKPIVVTVLRLIEQPGIKTYGTNFVGLTDDGRKLCMVLEYCSEA